MELLNLLHKLPEEGEKTWGAGGTYEKLMEELRTRQPFQMLLDEDFDDSLPNLVEQVAELREEIKKLKRHKHDIKTNDVMIRI